MFRILTSNTSFSIGQHFCVICQRRLLHNFARFDKLALIMTLTSFLHIKRSTVYIVFCFFSFSVYVRPPYLYLTLFSFFPSLCNVYIAFITTTSDSLFLIILMFTFGLTYLALFIRVFFLALLHVHGWCIVERVLYHRFCLLLENESVSDFRGSGKQPCYRSLRCYAILSPSDGQCTNEMHVFSY